MSLDTMINNILKDNFIYKTIYYTNNGDKYWKKYNKNFTIIYYKDDYVIIDKRKRKLNIYNSKSFKNLNFTSTNF